MRKEAKKTIFKKIISLNIVSWVLGIVFYTSSLSYSLSLDLINAVLIFIIASITFPPVYDLFKKLVYKHYQVKLGDFQRLLLIIFLFLIFNFLNPNKVNNDIQTKTFPPNQIQETSEKEAANNKIFFQVLDVIDGDTIKVDVNGRSETIRLIGIDSPETVHPEKPVECFGQEASAKLEELLGGKKVYLEKDDTQDNYDKYSRLLRYVYREDDLFINKWLIENGYAFEYTYKIPYIYQKEFREAQKEAKTKQLGLWEKGVCDDLPKSTISNNECSIKGNISYTTKEKIFHTLECPDYDKTVINENKGERWFCTEEEAIEAGWKKAKNCP